MSIHQHFRPDEQPFVDRVLEWAENASVRHQTRLTDFLDPREQFILRSVAGSFTDIKVLFFGGYEQAERKRGLIVPEYVQVDSETFQMALLSICPSQGKSSAPRSWRHRDVLGSLAGLGIKRTMIGDILMTEDEAQVIVAAEMADFIQLHLQKIGRVPVTCASVDWSHLKIPEDEWQYINRTVSSLRVDVIVSELIRLSRTKTTRLIKAGRVKVNWKIVDQPAETVEEGDVLSVQGFGRYLFAGIEMMTKKQKYRVLLGKKD